MKVSINKSLCVGNGMCRGIAPEAFRIGEDGKSHYLGTDNEELVREAEENCPVGAIVIEEEEDRP